MGISAMSGAEGVGWLINNASIHKAALAGWTTTAGVIKTNLWITLLIEMPDPPGGGNSSHAATRLENSN
jgi:hypothetical protein